ncbi:terminase large subunit domain-containing protein [Gordonia asplenii]|uniref:terminase large subunit domain-containing protein n=1 Tax=Gordonia asplenii TaxID=2725283 RepID=UPI001FEAF02F|nr:terminase family protein [Gordonia asplenii]
MPPREGKSTLVSQVGPLCALADDPDARVILASYGDDLAREHSHEARALVSEFAQLLGFTLASDKTAVGRWRVEGARGGLLAAGILSGITGFGADLLIVDDPVKNAQEADSAAHRHRVIHEFRSTLMTRLSPDASVVLIQTRWHPEDLAGTLLAEEPDRWTHINIPAIAAAGVSDALSRAPGVAMTSARGRTRAHFDDLRASVGERTWHALFQGVPAPPEGGLVQRAWFDRWRLAHAPESPVMTVIGVDPSDSGRGDSCGLIAASITTEGVVVVIADRSAPMTSDEWARAATQLAHEVGASEIAVEGFAARETYTRVVSDALDRHQRAHPHTAHRPRVTSWPPRGSGRGGGDAIARSSALLQAIETGTCRIAGHLHGLGLEDVAVLWQAGQHQPDQLAALVVAHDVLVHTAGRPVEFSVPRGRLGDPAPVTSMGAYLRQRVDRGRTA